MTYTIIDKQLRDHVVKFVRSDETTELKKILKLLKKGANPKADVVDDEFSAYSLVEQYNKKGQYNGVLEIFDEYRLAQSRPSDSDWEGMHS